MFKQFLSIFSSDQDVALTSQSDDLQNSEIKHLPNIPDDLWIYIFSFIDRKTILIAGKVSKKFNALSKNNHYWEKINKKLISSNPLLVDNESQFNYFKRHFRRLNKIESRSYIKEDDTFNLFEKLIRDHQDILLKKCLEEKIVNNFFLFFDIEHDEITEAITLNEEAESSLYTYGLKKLERILLSPTSLKRLSTEMLLKIEMKKISSFTIYHLLYLAAEESVECFKALDAHGHLTDPHSDYKHRNKNIIDMALHCAVGAGNSECTKYLLSSGATDSNMKYLDKFDGENLIENSFDMYLKKNTNLQRALKRGNFEIFRQLLLHPDATSLVDTLSNLFEWTNWEKNYYPDEIRHKMKDNFETGVLRILDEYPNLLNEKQLLKAIDIQSLKTIAFYLESGNDINKLLENGSTLLHHATVQCQIEVIRFLLAHGANPNVADKNDKLPIYYAGDTKCIELLSAIDLNLLDQKGLTLLENAILACNEILVSELIKRDVIITEKAIKLADMQAEKYPVISNLVNMANMLSRRKQEINSLKKQIQNLVEKKDPNNLKVSLSTKLGFHRSTQAEDDSIVSKSEPTNLMTFY